MNNPGERCHWCGVPKRGETGIYKEYTGKYIFWFCCQEELDLWIEKYKVKAS